MTRLHRLYSLLIVFSLLACDNDFLDRPPLDAISTDAYWQKAKDLENYVLQYYPTLPGHGTYAGGYGYPVNHSDDAILATPSAEMNGVRGMVGGRWTSDWANIRSVNIFFDNYQKCKDDFELYKHYLGEAHFFRAWYYFILLKKYGSVPWYSFELKPDMTDELMRPRTPRHELVNHILEDLDKASEYLSMRSSVGNNRLNRETALAFKTRVALYEGTWQKYHAWTQFATEGADPNKYFQATVDAFRELSGKADYQAELHDDYYQMFGLDDMSSVKEVLFYKAYNYADGLSNDMQYATILYAVEIGITWSLVSSYLDKNGKPYDFLALAREKQGSDFLRQLSDDLDPRYSATVWGPGDLQVANTGLRFDKPRIDETGQTLCTTGFQLKKGSNPTSSGAGKGGSGNSETGYIYFRYGEVILNYVEALYELNGEVDDEALNLLRRRVGMPDFAIIPQQSDPGKIDYGYPVSDALYGIRRERRIELAMEGFRTDDYKRWAAHKLFKGLRPKGYPFKKEEFPQFNARTDENGLIDYYQSSMPAGYGFREEQDYLSPIPQDELSLNPGLTQNPGW